MNTRYTSILKILSIQVIRENVMKQILSLSRQLGLLFQAARKSADLPQMALAQRLGTSQSRVSTMELDPGSSSMEQLLALLAALNHEVLVQPKHVAADVSDDAIAGNAVATTRDW